MASIYKRENSKVWQCAFYVPDPVTGKAKQVRKSTDCSSKAKAQSAALKLEEEEKKKAGPVRIVRSAFRRFWWMRMTGHTDSGVHQAYSHHEVETLARAIAKLPGLK